MVKNNKKLLYLFKKEHNGVVSFEFVIQFPLMIMTFLFLLYFFFMMIAYITYNNMANTIAQKLNMRQTGYEEALNYSCPQIYTQKVIKKGDVTIEGGHTISASEIIVTPDTAALRHGTYFAITEFAESNRFALPFAQLDHITVKSTKPINIGIEKDYVDAIIEVTLSFRTMSLLNPGKPSDLIQMHAHGYSVIE